MGYLIGLGFIVAVVIIKAWVSINFMKCVEEDRVTATLRLIDGANDRVMATIDRCQLEDLLREIRSMSNDKSAIVRETAMAAEWYCLGKIAGLKANLEELGGGE